jgi:Flp pilus assembly protein TadD
MRSLAIVLVLGLACAAGCASPLQRDPGDVADAYVAAGRYREAAREIELAVRARPRDPSLRRRAAQIQAQAGDLARAVGHLELVIFDLAPSDAEAWIELAEIEKQRDERDGPGGPHLADAYVAFRRAAELAPDDIRAVSGLALTADSLGFEEEAEAAYAAWAELERQQGQE